MNSCVIHCAHCLSSGELVPVPPGVVINDNHGDGLPMPPPYQEPEQQDQVKASPI